ncbi:hypothetical protein [Trichloromonas sp.]|uniref:hypothetical protein n=1 Tax=Trichloromonas sp. TaxID=3069249 RepID=UPI002A3965EC|nr:hypothetical protein [Trichloromonas sp.]
MMRADEIEQTAEYLSWISEIDERGAAAELAWLEKHVDTAPEPIKKHEDYQYFRGFLDGRLLHERFGGV